MFYGRKFNYPEFKDLGKSHHFVCIVESITDYLDKILIPWYTCIHVISKQSHYQEAHGGISIAIPKDTLVIAFPYIFY